MKAARAPHGNLFAVSDLHVNHPENRRLVQEMLPLSEHDWLLACGDVGESLEEVEWALGLLAERFDTVVWVPGNHELWTFPDNPSEPRGQARYLRLVDICRDLEVLTPEDPYPIWEGTGGPMTIAPLFVLYDYTFGRNIAATKREALALAQKAGVVCSDEFLLHSDPFPSREAWCDARVTLTESRLAECDPEIPSVLVNHFPLTAAATRALWHPEFAQWCGTVQTADWHQRYRASVVVYGHLHIPRTTWHDGVRFEEVSLGYPRERQFRGSRGVPRAIFPVSA